MNKGQPSEVENNTVESNEVREYTIEQVPQEPLKVIIESIRNIQTENNKRERFFTYSISIFGTIINLILAIYTYKLWQEAINATKIAGNSLKETQKAVSEAIRSNKIAESNYNLSKEEFDSTIASQKEADKISRASSKLQEKSIEAQIQSIEETRKQFEISNEPILQITEAVISKFKMNEPISGYYEITNFGNQPVHEEGFDFTLYYVSKSIYNNFVNNPFKYIKFDPPIKSIRYFSKEKPITTQLYQDGTQPTSNNYKKIMELGGSIFLAGKIIYANSITNRRSYTFIIEYLPRTTFPNPSFRFIFNLNTNIKKR